MAGGAEACFAQDDGMPQRLFGAVIGGLDARRIDEGEERFAVCPKVTALALQAEVAARFARCAALSESACAAGAWRL